MFCLSMKYFSSHSFVYSRFFFGILMCYEYDTAIMPFDCVCNSFDALKETKQTIDARHVKQFFRIGIKIR